MRNATLILAAVVPIAVAAQDAVRVRADNPATWGTNVRLVPNLTVGMADGPREYMFGRIDLFAVRPDGKFYIYDGKDRQIAMYDASGKFVARIGRLGDGPGEYRLLQGMAVVDDTVLAAWDPRNLRLSYFGSSGKLLESRTVRGVPAAFGRSPFGVDAHGVHYFRGVDLRRRDSGGQSGVIYIRVSRSGALIDTLPVPMENAGAGAISIGLHFGARKNFHVATISARYAGGGLVSGRNDRYAISFRPAPGDPPLVVERTHERVTVHADERSEWDAFARDRERSQPPPNARVITGPPFEARPTPPLKPVFRSLFADADGRVWIELYVAAVKGESSVDGRAKLTWHEPTVYDVIHRDGTYLGRIRLPENTELMAAEGNTVWLRGEGPDGEPVMVRHTIARS
jgi:hypothetical protein